MPLPAPVTRATGVTFGARSIRRARLRRRRGRSRRSSPPRGSRARARARASKRPGQPATIRMIRSSGSRRMSRTALVAGDAAQRLDLLGHGHRDAGHRQTPAVAERVARRVAAAWRRKSDRRARRREPVPDVVGHRQHGLRAVQRLADDAREERPTPPGSARPAGRRSSAAGSRRRRRSRAACSPTAATRRSPSASRSSSAASCGDRRRSPPGTARRTRRSTRRRRRRGRYPEPSGPNAVEQQPRSVEVDAVALLEIGLRLAGDDGGEVEDDVGPARRPVRRRLPGSARSATTSSTSKRRGGRRCGLDDVDEDGV